MTEASPSRGDGPETPVGRNAAGWEWLKMRIRNTMHLRPALLAFALGVLTFLAYLASPVSQATADSRYTILLSETLIHRGTFRLDASFRPPLDPSRYAGVGDNGLPYQVLRSGGGIYLAYPVGSSLLSIPLVGVLNLAGVRTHTADWLYDPAGDDFAQRLLAALVSAAAVAVILHTARRLLPVRWALLLALGVALGTMAWSTASRALWSDCWGILLGALVVDCLVAASNRPMGRGEAAWIATLLAWAYVVRPTQAIACIVVTGLVACRHRRRFLPFAATAGLWAVLFFLCSRLTYGSWVPPYYRLGSRLQIDGIGGRLAGVLISPSRGLLVFMPTLPWLAAVMVLARRRLADRPLILMALAISALMIALNGAWPVWWGGYSYGPRLLAGLLPWLALLYALGLAAWLAHEEPRIWVRQAVLGSGALLLALSLAIHGRGALDRSTWDWNSTPASVDADQARLWTWLYSQPLTGLLPYPLPPGERIPMGGPAAAPYLAQGWAHGEGSHRWNEGRRARLEWRGGDFSRERTLVLSGSAFRSGASPERPRVRVWWDGKQVGEGEFDGELRFPLPPGGHRFRHVLDFEFPDAVSPASLGLGKDTRRLSVGFREIRFE